jgi:hypothetical protein
VLVSIIGVCLLSLVSVLPRERFDLSPPPEQKDFGRYRVVKVERNSCGPWQELYFEETRLSTCETPSGSWVGKPQPIPDPYCFAIAPDASSAAYWHEPVRCGGQDRTLNKPSGIYAHSTGAGERLIYKTGDGLSRGWGGPIVDGGLSIGTAPGGRDIVIGFDGRERVQ